MNGTTEKPAYAAVVAQLVYRPRSRAGDSSPMYVVTAALETWNCVAITSAANEIVTMSKKAKK